jgi:hypothetical protein
MVWQLGTTKEPMVHRSVRGFGLALIGIAVIGSVAIYVGDWRLKQVIVRAVPPPEANWFLVAVVALLGLGILAAGIRILKPNAGESLIAVGVALTLVGVFEYWWDEMFIALDGYPNVNWALTIPVTALGLGILTAGISVYRRQV